MKYQLQGGDPPVDSQVGANNHNFTKVYGSYDELLTTYYLHEGINQLIIRGPHIVGFSTSIWE